LAGFEDPNGGESFDEEASRPVHKRSTHTLHERSRQTASYEQEMAAIAGSTNSSNHGSCCSMYGAVFDALCCCQTHPKGAKYDPAREAIMQAPRWKFAWLLLLLGLSWVPIVAGAVYAHDHREAPQLRWYWCVPLSLAAMALVFTLPSGFHVHLARSHWASYGQAVDSYSSPFDEHSAQLRSFQSLLAVCILLCTVGSAITTLTFAWRDYWDQLLPDGSPVDTLPAWLALFSTLLALAALACRLREVYLWDKREARAVDSENGLTLDDADT